MKKIRYLILLSLAWILPSWADAAVDDDVCTLCDQQRPLLLQSYEPSSIGIRGDSNDVNYVEFKISLKYPIGHKGRNEGDASMFYGLPFFYFGFTGVWGQYIGTRQSSPVIAKRYSPEIFGRWWLNDDDDYLDVVLLGHESNGQSIDRYSIFTVQQFEIAAVGDNPEFARDYISRGWDYVGMTWKNGDLWHRESLTSYLKLKYFLPHGVMQGDIEDYNPWEDAGTACSGESPDSWTQQCRDWNSERTRDHYDGISFILKNDLKYDSTWLRGNKFAIIYTTGYNDVFKNNTLRAELTTTFFNFPIMLWAQTGYNSDFTDYYKKVDSVGLALELKSFL